ncbi:MAG: hypothetical protein VX938_04145, partial [Myxococcota bacterium]|nr:hypothetical protein [Myxococcota bacterium]
AGSLLVASRPPLGGWSVNTIQLPNDPGGELCNGPSFGGEECEADHWAFHPLAVVATDSPRFIYSAVHTTGSFSSSCLGDWDKFGIPPPPDECEWIGETTVQSTLRIAWPDGPGYLSAEVGPAGVAMGGSAAVATDGRIHLVTYDETNVGSGTGYVILGEADPGPDNTEEEADTPK